MNHQEAIDGINKVKQSYMGNKNRLLPWMGLELEKLGFLDQKFFIDLFGGGGMVSLYLAQRGMPGFINELLLASHFYHRALFDEPVEIKSTLYSVPEKVKLLSFKYQEVIVKEKETKQTSLMSLLGKNSSKKNTDSVSCDFVVDSQNGIFNSLSSLLRSYMMRFYSGREVFDLSCYFTNYVLEFGRNFQVQGISRCFDNTLDLSTLNNYQFKEYPRNVLPVHGDAIEFLESFLWNKMGMKSEDGAIYIDPPYGGKNSNYHQMYYVLEAITHAVLRLSYLYSKNCKDHSPEYAISATYPIFTSEIDQMAHIIRWGRRFNSANNGGEADSGYIANFEFMLERLNNTKIPLWVFSYNSDGSWANEETITKLLEKYATVETSRSKYTYLQRYTQQDIIENDLTGKEVGEFALEKDREGDTEEILFICRRKK